MNAFDLMKHIGFKGEVLPPPVLLQTTFTGGAAETYATFKFIGPAGKMLSIDWGEGTLQDIAMTGSLISNTRSYAGIPNATVVFSNEANPLLTRVTIWNFAMIDYNVSINTLLTYLDLACNNLSNIDISKNTKLSHLELYYNPITSLDISANPDITYLDISPCSIPSAGINTILARLVAAGKTSGNLYAQQATSAPPTGQGLTDKATLISRGWSVYTD